MKKFLLFLTLFVCAGIFSACDLLEGEEEVVLVIESPEYYDSDEYEFINIDGQKWMSRNLNLPDGTLGSCYDDNEDDCRLYGRMYTWAEAMGVSTDYNNKELGEISLPRQGICPEGSHLPSHEDWSNLYAYLQKNPVYQLNFTKQLGGAYDYNGYYRSKGDEVLMWSSTEYDVRGTNYGYEFAWLWSFHKDNVIEKDNAHKITKAYVRCIQDDGNPEKKSSSSSKVSSSSVRSSSSVNSSSSVASSSSAKETEMSSSVNAVYEGSTIQVDSLLWMSENLNVELDGSRCYNDDPKNCEKYGRLYTWAQAMNIDEKYDREELGKIAMPHQGICPDGFRLPTYAELEMLGNRVVDADDFINQLGGAYDYKGMYRSEGDEVLFWSSTEYDASGSNYGFEFSWLMAFHKDGTVGYDNAHKITGAYVRCVKDEN